MGIYLNPGNSSFKRIINNEIYVDKSLLIQYTNKIINTNDCYVCVSRPRRFGKSTDARMLVAYYDNSCDSRKIFNELKIADQSCYQEHLNQYNVILLNMQDFLLETNNIEEMLQDINNSILYDLFDRYSSLKFNNREILSRVLGAIHAQNGEQFIFVIDEWDCIFREYRDNKENQNKYLDFLRNLLKDKPYVALAYMTGILPIKKYGTHSALNMFKEISMLNPTPLAQYMGFSEIEVSELCDDYQIDFEDMKRWYDGYHLDNISLYNPRSVVYALSDKKYGNYWTSTETYEALKIYIDMNFDGLKDDIIRMLSGEKVYINVNKFQNDMTTFKSKDDVFTLLVHLGYLGYDSINKQVYIPNYEVSSAFTDSIEDSNWDKVTIALKNSQELLDATVNMDSEAVAKYIELAHLETSILSYNDENALSYTISLAYYTAKDHYHIIRELPSGKGFADLVFIPIGDKPAMIIELKYDQDVDSAIKQIKDKKYYFGLENYLDNLLLVGISYDKKTKEHSCVIEKYLQDK